MGVVSKDVKKKKRPPTFQHLPRDRGELPPWNISLISWHELTCFHFEATKLKKEWVEKKKLKSRWRAQKRKEGLDAHSIDEITRSSSLPKSENHQADGSAQEAPEARGSEDDSDISPEDSQPGSSDDSEDDGNTAHVKRSEPTRPVTRLGGDVEENRETSGPSRKKTSGPSRKKTRFTPNDPRSEKMSMSMQGKTDNSVRNPKAKSAGARVTEANAKPEEPSLHDLERMAYSPASLHTFKADPLHKRKVVSAGHSQANAPGRGRGNAKGNSQLARGQGVPGHGARDGFGARGAAKGEMTGRGQPNMKLRMNAMLERIKRDYT